MGMEVFQDAFSGEEIISNAYPSTFKFNNVLRVVHSKWVVLNDEDYDIGCGNAFGGGDQDAVQNSNVEKVLDLIKTFGYQETAFTKAQFQTWLKGYMQKVKKHLDESKPDRVNDFKTGAMEAFNWIKNNFDEFNFYTPESYDTENTIILCRYDEGEIEPDFIFFQDGLNGVLC